MPHSLLSSFTPSRHLIYWYLPIGYISTVLAHSYQEELKSSRISIHALAFVLTSTTFLHLHLIILAHKFGTRYRIQNNSSAEVLLFMALLTVGPIRGILMHYLAGFFDIDSGLSLIERVIVASSSTTFWLLFVSYLLNVNLHFRSEYRSLMAKAVSNKSNETSRADLSSYFSGIEKNLKTIKTKPEMGGIDAGFIAKVAQDLQFQIDNLIRPQSRRLWLSSIDEYPHIKMKPLIVDAVKNLDYPIYLAFALVLFFSISTLSTFMPSTEAVARSLIIVMVLFLINKSFRTLGKMNLPWKTIWPFIEISLLALMPILVGDFVLSYSHFNFDTPLSLTVYLIVPFLAISLSMIELIKSDQRDILRLLNFGNSIDGKSGFQTKQVAAFLHNSLQSELNAITQQLKHAVVKKKDSRAVLERLEALTQQSLEEEFFKTYSNPKERLELIISSWRGILDINVENSEVLFKDADKSVISVQLIEELASNTCKYSESDYMNVRCARIGNDIIMELESSFLPHEKTGTGLGSTLINAFLVDSGGRGPKQAKDKVCFRI